MTIKISELGNITVVQGNTFVPAVSNITGVLTTVKSTVDQLKTFIVANAEANILAANAATIFANTVMKGYVDGQITAANAGVTAANLGIVGYVNLANTIQSAQIASANLGIIGYVDNSVSTANIAMKGYVDSIASQSIYGNANVAAYLHTNNYNPYSNVNVAVFTNLSTYAYNANITEANLGMKGYVDSVATLSSYGNSNVASYLPTYSGNLTANTVDFNFLTVSDGPTGINSLSVGVPGISPFGNAIASFHGNINAPSHINVHNKNSGDRSLSGFVATAYSSTEPEAYNATLQVTGEGWNVPAIALVKPYDTIVGSIGGNLVILAHDKDFSAPSKDIVLALGYNPTYEKVRISNSSVSVSTSLIPSANVTYSLGDATHQWKDLWVSGNTIHIGGVALSISGNTLVVNGQAQSALYDLITSNVFLADLPGGYGNVTLNNNTKQIVFERTAAGSSDFTQFQYTLDGTDPATSGTAISLFLPELATQRINVSGNLTLKTTFVGGSPGSNATWYIYQYR